MATPSIHSSNVYILPQPVPAKRKVNTPPPHLRCNAKTQDASTKAHTGPQCMRKKVIDSDTPHAQKTFADLIADEVCKQHQKLQYRFTDQVLEYLNRQQRAPIAVPSEHNNNNGAAGPQVGGFSATRSSTAIEQLRKQSAKIIDMHSYIVPDKEHALHALRQEMKKLDLLQTGPKQSKLVKETQQASITQQQMLQTPKQELKKLDTLKRNAEPKSPTSTHNSDAGPSIEIPTLAPLKGKGKVEVEEDGDEDAFWATLL